MSYPVQATRAQILAQALKLIERNGELSLHDLARKLGIKAPSLYRHFDSRERLIAEVGLEGFRKLAEYIRSTTAHAPSPKAAAQATRRFAKRHPELYRIMNQSDSRFEDRGEATDVTLEVLGASFGAPVAEETMLGFRDAFRAIRAFIHGFIMLEINGQFRREGNLDQAFENGLDVLLTAFANQVQNVASERSTTPSVSSQ